MSQYTAEGIQSSLIIYTLIKTQAQAFGSCNLAYFIVLLGWSSVHMLIYVCPCNYGPRSRRTKTPDVLRFKKKVLDASFDSDANRQTV